jgi:tetratricopeptide (TPR) repeat protein
LDEAQKELQTALIWNDMSASIYHFLGLVSLAKNKPVKAQEYLIQGTILDSTSADQWFHLGQSYMRRKNWEDALRSLDKSHQLDNQNSETLYNLGQVYKKLDRSQLSRFYLMEFKKQSDYEKTRGNLLNQLQIRPNDLDLIRKLAYLYEENGRVDKAMVVWYKGLYFGDSTAVVEMERIKGTTSRP